MKQRVITPNMPLVALKPQTGDGSPPPTNEKKVQTILPMVSPVADKDSKVILRLPLSSLRIHPFNSRVVRPQERIEEVRDMLTAENKQREPITVVPSRHPDEIGIYYILSGQTRYHSANLAGWPDLEAQINFDVDPDDHLAFWAASLEHNTSIQESDWDVAILARKLQDEGHSLEQIRKASRRNERSLRRLLAMTELPEAIQAVIREHPNKMTAPFCESLKSGLEALGEAHVSDLAKWVVQDDVSQRDLIARISKEIKRKEKDKELGTKRATREFMLPVHIAGHDKRVGDFKILQSRQDGNRIVTLTADLPEKLADILKADIAAAISRISGECQ